MKVIIAKIFNFIGNRIKILRRICFDLRDKLVYSVIKNIFYRIDQKYSFEKKKKNNAQRIIWVYWAQGLENAPILVKKCIKTLKEQIKEYDIVVINNNNMRSYVDIPEYIYNKVKNNKITLTHFSDILRINLISKYGGIWIDSTVFISKEFNQFINKEKNIITIPQKNIDYNVSNGKWSAWLIGSKINVDAFYKMKLFFDEYWKRYDILPCYFLIDYLMEYVYENDVEFRKYIDECEQVDFSVYELASKRKNKCNKDEFTIFLKEHFINKLNYKIDYSAEEKNTFSYYIFNNE